MENTALSKLFDKKIIKNFVGCSKGSIFERIDSEYLFSIAGS